MARCPCMSGRDLDECCGPIIKNQRTASTAEELMKARYSAYATQAIDFLEQSTHRLGRKGHDRKSAMDWSTRSTWKGLDIVSTEKGGEDDNEGTVEFIARYAQDGEDLEHHEIATFRKSGSRWYFLNGKIVGQGTYVRSEPKIGRNAPCPCQSGKKYKKCCGR